MSDLALRDMYKKPETEISVSYIPNLTPFWVFFKAYLKNRNNRGYVEQTPKNLPFV